MLMLARVLTFDTVKSLETTAHSSAYVFNTGKPPPWTPLLSTLDKLVDLLPSLSPLCTARGSIAPGESAGTPPSPPDDYESEVW